MTIDITTQNITDERKGKRHIAPVYIVGPTASGKSALAVRLARKLDGVVISADSMQIYRGLDVLTAKESPEVRREVPHKLIDVLDPTTEYSVAEFAEDAKREIGAALENGKLPIVVGGTGLYFEALFYPLSFADTDKNSALREELHAEYEKYGAEYMHGKLAAVDPESAAKLHPNDVKRVIRALEIAACGEIKSRLDDRKADPDVIAVGLNTDRAVLYDRINKRVDKMFAEGLTKEALAVQKRGYQSAKAIGYREFAEVLQSETGNCDGKFEDCGITAEEISQETLAKIKDKIKQDTRNYAKRQLTWFRRYPFVKWFDCEDLDGAESFVETELTSKAGRKAD